MRQTWKIILISLLILLVSQVFMAVLASNSYEKIHVASELSRYAVPQKDFKRKIEAALRFGKPLDNLLGMETLIEEYARKYDDLKNIAVCSPGHEVFYSLHPVGGYASPLEERGKRIDVPDLLMEVVESEESYLIILPLFGPGETWMGTTAPASAWAGSVVFSFDKQHIRTGVRVFWEKRLALGAVIAGFASLLLFVLLFRISGPEVALLRKRIFVRVLGVTILAQIVFAGANAFLFHQDHVLVLRDRVHAQLDLLRSEVERVLARGVDLERISRMDEFLAELLDVNPEIVSLSMHDEIGEVRAQALKHGRDMIPNGRQHLDSGLAVTLPLRVPDHSAPPGILRAELDRKVLGAMIRKLLLDALTVALIASLFIVEQIYFLVSFIGRRRSPPLSGASDQEALDILMLARFGAFAFLFAFALPVSFVPLQMRELYTPLWNLPRNVVLGLPVSLEMLCALLSSLVAGTLADRRGWQTPFLAGIVVTAGGLFFCSQAVTGGQFILARGVCGLGYGLSWMALQTFLFAHSTPTTRARGSSHFVAGIFSGHICGTALGAMLAERMGYSPVFLVGMVLALGSSAFFFLFMRTAALRPARGAPTTFVLPRAVAAYLVDRNTFALIFCCVIPFSICQVGLLFFATPLYLDQLGIGQADIGRVLMIYGLSVVYLAPQLSKIVDRQERKKPFIVAGGLLGGLGLSLLFLDQGFWVVIGAIFLLGVASSIGNSAQTAFALKLRATQDLGAGKAMAIQRAADKLGQMLGPLALGLLMSGMSIAQGIVLLGVGYMILSLLFLVLARERFSVHSQTAVEIRHEHQV